MSENIVIQEGGVGKNLNAIKKIQTADQGGGSVYWIPEEEIELGTKTITKNGLYKASKSGVDGWSQVFVNVPGGESKTDSDGDLTDEDGNKVKVDSDGNPTSDGSGTTVRPKPSDNGGNGTGVTGTNGVSGINPNDGNEYHVTKNPNTGELIYTKIPSSIRVTKAPDKTHYTSGETINPSGIIVHAYYKDGTDHGTVLNSELRYEPLSADISQATEAQYSSDLPTNPHQQPLVANSSVRVGIYSTTPGAGYDFYLTGGKIFTWWNSEVGLYWVGFICASSEQINMTSVEYRYGDQYATGLTPLSSSFTYDGKTVYYVYSRQWVHVYSGGGFQEGVPSSNIGEPSNPAYVAWTLVYGDTTGGGQEITVKWDRPTDGKTLTDTFNIDVSPSASEESGGGGSHGF